MDGMSPVKCLIFTNIFVLLSPSLGQQSICIPECHSGSNKDSTSCTISAKHSFVFPHLDSVVPFCNGYSNVIQFEMTFTNDTNNLSRYFQKEFYFNSKYKVKDRYSVSFEFTNSEYDYSLYEPIYIYTQFEILDVELGDAGIYNFTFTEPYCYSSERNASADKQFFHHTFNLSVCDSLNTSPRCNHRCSLSNNHLSYDLVCSVDEVYPPVKIDIISTKPCILQKNRTSGYKEKKISASVFSCDIAAIICITKQQPKGQPLFYENCTFEDYTTVRNVTILQKGNVVITL